MAGHDLKNPLTALGLQMKILNEVFKDDQIHKNFDLIAQITSSSDRQIKRFREQLDRMILLIDTKLLPEGDQ